MPQSKTRGLISISVSGGLVDLLVWKAEPEMAASHQASHGPVLRVACVCTREQYRVLKHHLFKGAFHALHVHDPTLVALLLSQPDLLLITGEMREQLIRLRDLFPSLPLIVWSYDADQQSIARVLDQGADDYILPSCGQEELCARLRAHVRRARQMPSLSGIGSTLESQDHQICLDRQQRRAIVRGNAVSLTPIEYALLWLLLSHTGNVLTHATLLRIVWGEAYQHEVGLLRVHMRYLRHKIEEDPSSPSYLETIVGIGYRFRQESSPLKETETNTPKILPRVEGEERP